jgi:nicotinate-nucleotide adenylyltransferase
VRLAVFGGTFDPPHNGHLALCLYARELLAIDRLIISVSNNPFKQKRGAADEHRKRMAELLSDEINRTGCCCQVSGWELEKKQPSYTVDLLRYVHELYPRDRLTLLIGEDSFREFSTWKDYRKLMYLCDIAVFRRAATEDNFPSSGSLSENGTIEYIDFAYEVSSTEIREFVAEGQSISRLVPPEVNHYIKKHGLYRSQELSTSTQEQKRRES